MDRMHELIKKINEASDAYYNSGIELMSNHEWDALYDELEALEKETGIVMANSPTINVGPENEMAVSDFEKIKHEISVKSLNKTKDINEIMFFIGNRPGIMSWKLDGLTTVLTYSDGKLIKAVTRGKNGVGELITNNAKHFTGVPEQIPYKGRLHVRGEAVISYTDFEKVNTSLPEGEEPYKNPRNLASGSVRQRDPKEVKNRKVQFVAFSSTHKEATHEEEFKWLKTQGFVVVDYIVAKHSDEIPSVIEIFRKRLKTNDLPSDGLVLQFNESAYGESLGETDKFPRDAIAFKWQDEEKETTVREIFWSPSRTGLINPVAVFDPIELNGTSVERASVHNVSTLKQLSLTPGDTITVYKANMIIPQVSANLTMLDAPAIPDVCPACGGHTEIRTGRDGSEALYCTNPDCSAKHIKRFVHAVKQDALNIEGVSEKTIENFINHGFLRALPDLFRLERFKMQMELLEGYGEKSVAAILAAVEKARKTDLQKLIYACGIEFVGRTASKAICRHFDYDVQKALNATKDELMSIEDIGERIAESYTGWFKDQTNQEMFENLLSQIILIKPEAPKPVQSNQNKPGISGKKIVITGNVYLFKNRNAFKAYVEEHGGKVIGSISKNTDFLVTNTPNSDTSKNVDAKQLGTPIITEQELVDMIE